MNTIYNNFNRCKYTAVHLIDGRSYWLLSYFNTATRETFLLHTKEKTVICFDTFEDLRSFAIKHNFGWVSNEKIETCNTETPPFRTSYNGLEFVYAPKLQLENLRILSLIARHCDMYFEGNSPKYRHLYNFLYEYCCHEENGEAFICSSKRSARFWKDIMKVYKRRNRVLSRLELYQPGMESQDPDFKKGGASEFQGFSRKAGGLVECSEKQEDTEELDFASRLKQMGYKFEPVKFEQDIDPEEEEIRFQGIVEDVKAGRKKISELSAVDVIKLNIYCREKLEEMETFESDEEDDED